MSAVLVCLNFMEQEYSRSMVVAPTRDTNLVVSATARCRKASAGKSTGLPIAKLVLFLALGWAGLAWQADAQELTRESLAGSEAASSGNTTSSADQPNYNLRIGPVRFLADVSAGFEYIDNITYSDNNRLSDEVFRLALNVRALWDITRLNTLDLRLGVGFVRYIEHPEAAKGDVFITPGSQLAFDVYVADTFRFNFHDSFALLQDPVDTPEINNATNFGRFINTAGVTVVGDFNTIIATVGYDHTTYDSLNSTYDYLDRNAEQFLASLSYKLAPRTFIGVEGTAAITRYDHSQQINQNDSVGGTGGAFLDITPTPYLRVVARGGYQYTSFDTDGTFSTGQLNNGASIFGITPGAGRLTDDSTLSDFYWNLTLSNRINAYLTQSLSAGRENDFGLTSNYITVNYVRYNIAWRALSNVTIGGDGFYENDQESGGLFDEHLQRYGGDITLSYQFNPNLVGTLHYYGIIKDSDTAGRDYYQNRVGIDVDYRF